MMCGRAETATEQSESTVSSPNSPRQPDAELGRCPRCGGLMVTEGLVEELSREVVRSASIRQTRMWTWKQTNTKVRGDAFYGLCVGRLVDKVAPYAHVWTPLKVLASPLTEGSGALPIVDDQRRLVGTVSEFERP